MRKAYYIFIIFCVTAVLVFTVYLRREENHIFYEFYNYKFEQNRLQQELGRKQLRLENIINPWAVSETIEK